MISFADLFCGAGGATTGVLLASQRRGLAIRDGVAINHWPVAVETHSANHPHSIKEPLRSQTASGHHALCSSFLLQYYGRSGPVSLKQPCPTLSTRDRFLLVNAAANEKYELQIFFSLLKPKELAAVHSFPHDYKFAGNKTQQVKQIGNSNPVELTAALTSMVL